jgi:hypothetical protein
MQQQAKLMEQMEATVQSLPRDPCSAETPGNTGPDPQLRSANSPIGLEWLLTAGANIGPQKLVGEADQQYNFFGAL